MEQPDKRYKTDEKDDREEEKKIGKQTGNKFLKLLRDSRKEGLKIINSLKEKLFIPLSDDQIIGDVGKVVRVIEENSSNTSSIYFSFDVDQQYKGDVNLYKLLFNIKSVLTSDKNYKDRSMEFERIFIQFKNSEIRRLAAAVAKEIDFPLYDYKFGFKVKPLKPGVFDPPYGVSIEKKEIECCIQVWWGIDPE
jgi:hypothetical protein